MVPTTAAVTLVLTATGASVAESRGPANLEMTGAETLIMKSQEAEQAADTAQIAQRRGEASATTAVVIARQAATQRAARARERVALAKKVAAAKKAAEAHKWIMPLKSWTFTSGYKMRWGRLHAGNDLAAPHGTPIMAMSQGIVVFAGWQGGFGNKVEIQYWDGTVSYFGHMSRIASTVGEHVFPGDVVGYVGNTGHSFGDHLHLEIHPDGQDEAIDPTPWLHQHGLFLRD